MAFLPITREDMKNRGWDELDLQCILRKAFQSHQQLEYGNEACEPRRFTI